jgi:hypothetical protein
MEFVEPLSCVLQRVQTAIASRKRELQSEQQELEAVLAAGTAAGLHPLDQPDIQPTIKVCSNSLRKNVLLNINSVHSVLLAHCRVT